jgi:hypothetical protein
MNLASLTDKVILAIKSNYYLFKLLRLPGVLLGHYRRKLNVPLEESWIDRIEVVVKAPDNLLIDRVSDAGAILGDAQIMHNGIKINVGSYYGDGNTALLFKNKGVHEPQEERAFEEVLKYIPEGAIMLELGSFWAFYSMTFLKSIKDGKSYLIEPDKHALLSGQNNFRLNGLNGQFFNYFISDVSDSGLVPLISVSDFFKEQKLNHINILHSDIQGYELKMLEGADELLLSGKIDYLFISTHSNELHYNCMDYLTMRNYVILCDADLNQSFSWDGLIVAKHSGVNGPSKIEISLR